MIAPDGSPALREEYTRRAGLAAAYREAAVITHPDQAVSLEPHRGNPELENMRMAVFTALEIRDEAGILRGLHRGELEAQVLAGERAQASAPLDVSGTLRVTAQAEADALRQSADAEVQHDEFEADLQAAERAIARQRQAAIDAGEPWPPQRTAEPNPSSAPEPDAGPTSKASPEVEPAPAKPEQDDRSAWLDELLARADQAARRRAAQQAERQASSEYAARIEREAQAQPEAGRQAESRDEAEIEM